MGKALPALGIALQGSRVVSEGEKEKGGKGRREGPCRCERKRERSLVILHVKERLSEVGWGMRRGWVGMG